MKKLPILFSLLVILPLFAFTQILEPVKWSFRVEQNKPEEATLLLIAKADPGWHVYSQDIPAGGPIPTTFTFEKNSSYELIGKVVEPKAIEENDPNFDMVSEILCRQGGIQAKDQGPE